MNAVILAIVVGTLCGGVAVFLIGRRKGSRQQRLNEIGTRSDPSD